MNERSVAIVTGGSAGIGATICRQMIEAGYEVISLARRKPDWSHLALHAVEVDLTDAKATEQAAADLARRFPISTVVHNAGIIRPNLLPDVRQEDLSDLAQLHLGAAILLVQAALPGMRERHFGRVVLISSRAALGLPTRTVYSATKAGMIGMARTWALELAPDGITVNVVAPGPIEDTEMFGQVVPSGSEARRGSRQSHTGAPARAQRGRRPRGHVLCRSGKPSVHHRPSAVWSRRRERLPVSSM